MANHKKINFSLLQVINPHYHRDLAVVNMAETELLVISYGGQVVDKSIQHRVAPHPDIYIGKGKLEWLKSRVKTEKIDVVVINDTIKSGQLFRLERILWESNIKIQVWDRIDLILNIFEEHAQTKEAKLQIELARLKHQGPRIYGLGGSVLSRQGAGIGTRGIGETNIETERRLIKSKSQQLIKKLAAIKSQKQSRLEIRKERGFGPVALVGYTSAGKTSLFNALTGRKKQVDPGLFTTLDTVVGKMKSKNFSAILISDTIGFIQNLPPVLIEAFQSTLMESLQAKLTLHVVDATDPRILEKISIVSNILVELKLGSPIVLVFNKIDRLNKKERAMMAQNFAGTDAVFVSTLTGEGLENLRDEIEQKLTKITLK